MSLDGRCPRLSAWAFLLTCWNITAFAQDQPVPRPVHPMLLGQSSYRLRAGDRVPIVPRWPPKTGHWWPPENRPMR
jgi:hypothetical protein